MSLLFPGYFSIKFINHLRDLFQRDDMNCAIFSSLSMVYHQLSRIYHKGTNAFLDPHHLHRGGYDLTPFLLEVMDILVLSQGWLDNLIFQPQQMMIELYMEYIPFHFLNSYGIYQTTINLTPIIYIFDELVRIIFCYFIISTCLSFFTNR